MLHDPCLKRIPCKILAINLHESCNEIIPFKIVQGLYYKEYIYILLERSFEECIACNDLVRFLQGLHFAEQFKSSFEVFFNTENKIIL